MKKRKTNLNGEANIIRVSALARVKYEALVYERADGEVLAEIRARMDAEKSDRDRAEF